MAPFPIASFESPIKFGRNNAPSFAAAVAARGSSPFKQQEQQPPHTSFFNPQLRHRPSAPQFRNPAFTTPQKRVDELAHSEFSGAESSPALTDTSEAPADTPELDRDREEDFGKRTITASARTLFRPSAARNRSAGRGEIPRGTRDLRARKRKRQMYDKDVGSVRSRLQNDSDGSDSDFEDTSRSRDRAAKEKANRGWFHNFLKAVSAHPSAPAILSKWLQLGVNMVLMGVVLFGILAIVGQVRSDLSTASEKARVALVHEMAQCSDHYAKNQCFPKTTRAPALEGPCNEWEACMNQDSSAIMKVQISARNVAEIMNEFVGVLTLKTWAFVMSLFVITVIASNIGFGFLRESALSHQARSAQALQSPPAALPTLGSGNQAYIWAPVSHTPRRFRNQQLVVDDATDTDNSPQFKAIMPPKTPSGRSPSKGDRGRSPTKGERSPSKTYR
ncbi:Di-sulfide bridge nucleocytoplasmic transport domain-containing protein [Podospora appendiculata]|uniref:Di-sulfide bridge nucleocytoplasmic transport domain-containing protein n=1 Tax=Podospora appendiculata TaxID=314037 RepID=A0AAE0XIQ5_9PEZI|nr:Di-sulfide bridge nucleocytoplasmic transport domain-containing protein [Podospora appendiculata]